MTPCGCFALFFASAAAAADLKTGKVPNCAAAAGTCAAWILAAEGGRSAGECLLSFLLPAFLLLPLFALRLIGGGDIKLLMVLGLCMGRRAVCQCILRMFLIGGLISVFLLIDLKDRKQSVHMTVPILFSVLLWHAGL